MGYVRKAKKGAFCTCARLGMGSVGETRLVCHFTRLVVGRGTLVAFWSGVALRAAQLCGLGDEALHL